MFGDAKRGDPVLIGHNRLSNAESCCGRSEMRRIAKITMHPKCVSVVRCTTDTCGSGGRRPGLTCQQVPEDPGGLLRQPLQARHRRRRAGRPDPARLVHLSAEADAPGQARGRRHRLRARGARLVDVPAGQPAGGAVDREARQLSLLVLQPRQDALPRREGPRGKGQHVLRGEPCTADGAKRAHAWPALTNNQTHDAGLRGARVLLAGERFGHRRRPGRRRQRRRPELLARGYGDTGLGVQGLPQAVPGWVKLPLTAEFSLFPFIFSPFSQY